MQGNKPHRIIGKSYAALAAVAALAAGTLARGARGEVVDEFNSVREERPNKPRRQSVKHRGSRRAGFLTGGYTPLDNATKRRLGLPHQGSRESNRRRNQWIGQQIRGENFMTVNIDGLYPHQVDAVKTIMSDQAVQYIGEPRKIEPLGIVSIIKSDGTAGAASFDEILNVGAPRRAGIDVIDSQQQVIGYGASLSCSTRPDSIGDFAYGDFVTWTSNGAEKTGAVRFVVRPGQQPVDVGAKVKDAGSARDHVSYVVEAWKPNGGLTLYWPRASLLRRCS